MKARRCIEEGETPAEAAIREVQEETGLRIEIVRLLLEMHNEKINGMYYCFLGEVIEGTARLGRDPELDEHSQQLKQLKWTDLAELTEHAEIMRIRQAIAGA
ncbi:NUDIX hydrolase [Paenibacillus mesophilus]|uniref:NUDIX hydrolase n=1 Tax=Paenibacillus mesophilus TaxID=2582849 RepID=UPI00110E6D30|nr:NUDIX hydrolase [Paenibacillus mesophilus]